MGLFKNRTDLQTLREAGKIAGSVCDALMDAAQPGCSSVELEAMANKLLGLRRASAPFKLFEGFGHAICLSLNEEIVNGPPSRQRILKEGDLVSIAIGSCYKGLHGKAARTRYLGQASDDIQRLLNGPQAVIEEALAVSHSATTIADILQCIPAMAKAFQLTLIEGSGGYGIGKQLHEAPSFPNQPQESATSIPLVPGMAFTLMPMMSLGTSGAWEIHEDGWTQVATDDSLSAHFAETFLMTENGLVVLTHPS